MPPILLQQYQLFNVDRKIVAFAAWAYVSEEVEARLQRPHPKMAAVDWKSGDRLWMVNLFAPFGHTELARSQLRESALMGKSFKIHRRNADGTMAAATAEA